MRTDFIKMHGLGNDFVVLDGRAQALPAMTPVLVRALADRHTGIGCDQLVVLEASDTADLKVRFFNHDGGEVQSCGNASRAVGLLLGQPAEVETLGGLIRIAPDGGGITVDMGQPRFEWDQIPLAYPMDTHTMPVAWEALDAPTAVNVGNPHVVFFVADTAAVELDRLGPEIEHDPLFPERINVNVASRIGPDHLKLRVWERGAGLTRACGTGACATAVAAIRRKLTGRTVRVDLPGGPLTISWPEGGNIEMTGPATLSFEGSFEDADFPA